MYIYTCETEIIWFKKKHQDFADIIKSVECKECDTMLFEEKIFYSE